MLKTICQIAPLALFFTNSISITISEEEKEIIKRLLSDKKIPWQIQKRLEAIRLLSKGLSQAIVAKQLCVRREIIYAYRKTYLQGGITALIRLDKPGKETLLTEEMVRNLENYITKSRKRLTNKHLSEWLLEKYHVSISPEWLGKRLAMRREFIDTEPWK